MFKKKCKKCNSNVSRKFKFCPSCGFPVNNRKDYGMLGVDDEEETEIMPGLGTMGGGMLNKMLGSAIKMLEKEMQKEMQNNIRNTKSLDNQPKIKSNLQLYINGKKVDIGEMQPGQVKRINMNNQKTQNKKSNLPMPSEELLIKSAKLPRKQAKHKLKRLSNKVIYEIDCPGVSSLDQILINKLEEGIEIRLFTKKAVLTKNIPINLPLRSFSLKKEKLFLEFQTK